MSTVEGLLARLAEAARNNQKAEFDRLERELLSQYEGGFEGMPREIYDRYLDVDRHWPIAVTGDPHDLARSLEVRIPRSDLAWVQNLAVTTDRSLSAVVARCLEVVRADPDLAAAVRETLERKRNTPE